jgi:hypothetical protein
VEHAQGRCKVTARYVVIADSNTGHAKDASELDNISALDLMFANRAIGMIAEKVAEENDPNLSVGFANIQKIVALMLMARMKFVDKPEAPEAAEGEAS